MKHNVNKPMGNIRISRELFTKRTLYRRRMLESLSQTWFMGENHAPAYLESCDLLCSNIYKTALAVE
jgi:hypothetical protein